MVGDMDTKPTILNKKLLLIVAIVSIIKIIAVQFIDGFKTFEDHEIAQNFIRHYSFFYFNDGVQNHSFQFPIYPILLSLTYSIHHSALAAITLNILLLSTSSLFIYSILKRTNNKGWTTIKDKWMIALSILPLFHPAFVYYELTCVHPFAHDFLFLTFSIYTAFSVIDSDKSNFEKGMMLGLTILARGTFIVFPTIAIVYLLFKKQAKKASIVLLGIILMTTPWIAHNVITDNVWGLTSTSGKILWKGSLHNSEGGNYLNNGATYYQALNSEELNELGHSTVKGQNDFFMQKYTEQWQKDPVHVLRMIAVKLKNFWFFSNQMGTEYPWHIKKMIPIIRLFNLLFIGALLFFSIKTRQMKWILVAFSFSFLQAVFYVEARHRLLIDPILIVILFHLLLSSSKKKAIA